MPTPKLTKCDHELVKKTLDDLGLTGDGSLKKCVERLTGYYTEHEVRLEIAGCDVCGGDSDSNLDDCPFCGESGVMEHGTPEPEALPPSKKKAAAKKKTAPPAKKKAALPTKKKTASQAKKKVGPRMGFEAKPKTAPAKKKAAAPKPKSAKITKVSDKVTKKVIKEPAAHITEHQLDAQIGIIQQEYVNGAISLHTMGTAFAVIRDTASWKTRMDSTKHGVPLHANFKAFCQNELHMHYTHVFRAMAASEEFKREDLPGLSGNQIRIVMQLPKGADRDVVMDAAKSGERGPALSDRAKGLQGDKGPATPPPAPKAVTVALTPGIQQVPMYKRPTKNAKVADPEGATPAVSITDHPWFALDMSNNVRLIVRISQHRDGSLQASVEHRRGEKI